MTWPCSLFCVCLFTEVFQTHTVSVYLFESDLIVNDHKVLIWTTVNKKCVFLWPVVSLQLLSGVNMDAVTLVLWSTFMSELHDVVREWNSLWGSIFITFWPPGGSLLNSTESHSYRSLLPNCTNPLELMTCLFMCCMLKKTNINISLERYSEVLNYWILSLHLHHPLCDRTFIPMWRSAVRVVVVVKMRMKARWVNKELLFQWVTQASVWTFSCPLC